MIRVHLRCANTKGVNRVVMHTSTLKFMGITWPKTIWGHTASPKPNLTYHRQNELGLNGSAKIMYASTVKTYGGKRG